MSIGGFDRRRAPRVAVSRGTALCRSAAGLQQFRVVDASCLGVRLEGMGAPEPGVRVRVDLWWPGVGAVRRSGQVVRTGPARELAVAFQEPKGTTAARGIEAARDTVIVYCSDRDRALSVSERLGCVSGPVIVANSFLEVVWQLQDCEASVGAVLVDTSFGGLELARFLQEDFDHLHRVLVVDDKQIVDGSLAEDAGLVHAVISADASPLALADVLGATGLASCLSCDGPCAPGDIAFCMSCQERSRTSFLSEWDELGVGD